MKKKGIVVIGIVAGVAVVCMLFLFILGGGLALVGGSKTGGSGNVSGSGKVSVSETQTGDSVQENVQQSSTSVDYETAYNGSGVPDVFTEEILEDYLEHLAPADDEYDFKYASDYQDLQLVKIYKCRDCSAYEKILGYKDATLEQIRQAIDDNDNIAPKYKDFIYQFACDLRTLYPDCNLAVFYHNLQTLVIDEMTQAEIDLETLSTNSAACYLRYENRVCIAEGLDLSRESDDYIILVHELCHAARTLQQKKEDTGNYDIDISFWDEYKMGTYAEEGIVTNISYELQGLGNRAVFYPMLASYYRIICSCIDYSGEDFFNHGVNYLIDQMDAFMGDEEYAYRVVAMIDAQMSLRYTPYQSVDFHDFQPLYEYLIKMYCKKNLRADMNYEQAEEVFDAFYEDITFNFENMNRGYDISEETFLETFGQCVTELGIVQENVK